ncbi:MAG TPA: hypothetical protein VF631_04115 [Allosphingosinicella sp.]|jgi:hypothetical protein|uniref:hypothetical protein n=1 Tax=Allosphingosinicella sp. TaxID=2823234 RepID=UPI002F28841A
MVSRNDLGLGSRMLIGGVAGFAATLAMTSVMARMHRRLPPEDQYPLTPREIVDSGAEMLDLELSDGQARDLTIAAHFAYGAGCGALIALAHPRIGKRAGALAGASVWLASYLGWIPMAGVLKPATQHPARRNLLMVAAHLVWGAATAQGIRELTLARETMLRSGPERDAVRAATRAAS